MASNLDDSNSSNMGKQKIGSLCTDQLVTLLKKKFISGPFIGSSIDSLRINRLITIEQGDKYWPILNLRAPEGNNEAVYVKEWVKSSCLALFKLLTNNMEEAILSIIDYQSAYNLFFKF